MVFISSWFCFLFGVQACASQSTSRCSSSKYIERDISILRPWTGSISLSLFHQTNERDTHARTCGKRCYTKTKLRKEKNIGNRKTTLDEILTAISIESTHSKMANEEDLSTVICDGETELFSLDSNVLSSTGLRSNECRHTASKSSSFVQCGNVCILLGIRLVEKSVNGNNDIVDEEKQMPLAVKRGASTSQTQMSFLAPFYRASSEVFSFFFILIVLARLPYWLLDRRLSCWKQKQKCREKTSDRFCFHDRKCDIIRPP